MSVILGVFEYDCGWCRHKFKKEVRQATTGSNKGRGNTTTAVRCPKCLNLLPWRSGK